LDYKAAELGSGKNFFGHPTRTSAWIIEQLNWKGEKTLDAMKFWCGIINDFDVELEKKCL